MKIFKTILLIVCIIIITIGMFIFGRNGLNYIEGYSENTLIETLKTYVIQVSVSTIVILLYLAIRYNKQGVIKVLATSILGILGAIALVVAIIAISRMNVSRVIIPILLATYVSSIIILTAYFEQNR